MTQHVHCTCNITSIINKKRQGNNGLCVVKLDMHKAYDRIEWGFLEKIVLKMSFEARWVKLIMTCVQSVRYRVRVNLEENEISKVNFFWRTM
jgi:hypothetical protein